LAVRGALFDRQFHQMSQTGSVDSPAGVVHATHHVTQPFGMSSIVFYYKKKKKRKKNKMKNKQIIKINKQKQHT